MKWGTYVGSPEENTPMYIWKRKHKTQVSDFVPLLTNDVFGLSKNSALLLTYSKVNLVLFFFRFSMKQECIVCVFHDVPSFLFFIVLYLCT